MNGDMSIVGNPAGGNNGGGDDGGAASATGSNNSGGGSGSGGIVIPMDQIIDHLQAMMYQEDASYKYQSFFPPHLSPEELERVQLNLGWREKICQWSYNVVDHFDMPREIVAISMDYFDRYLATKSNECSGNLALLASLTTLHIAIKIHSETSVKISTLASLSRGQFGPEHIEQMEWEICGALRWKLHPPTLFAFVSYFLMLFHPQQQHQQQQELHQMMTTTTTTTTSNNKLPVVLPPLHHSIRKELFEVAIYMAELSVCDSFFVSFPTSTVAMAAIVNVMDDMPTSKLSAVHRTAFWTLVQERFGFTLDPSRTVLGAQLQAARQRLRAMYTTATSASAGGPSSVAATETGTASQATTNDDDTRMETVDGHGSSYHNHYSQQHQHQQQHQAAAPSPSSPTSTTEMNVDDTATIGSSTIGDYGGGRDVSGCVEVEGPFSVQHGNKIVTSGTAKPSSTSSPFAGGGGGDMDDTHDGSPNEAPDSNNLRYSPSPLSSERQQQQEQHHHEQQTQQQQNIVSSSIPTSFEYTSSQQHKNIFTTSPLHQMNCSPIVSTTQ
mmetsp:Transcript_58058/g.141906  ORF Transcript_58058/g.141906 Transcript_58058/m.141906 type:complete len:554 (-) Transcript_58058:245-1906(-)